MPRKRQIEFKGVGNVFSKKRDEFEESTCTRFETRDGHDKRNAQKWCFCQFLYTYYFVVCSLSIERREGTEGGKKNNLSALQARDVEQK